MTQQPGSEIRRSLRVIRMVSELHRMGYQRVRFMPHVGVSYRILIAPAQLFSRKNPAYVAGEDEPCARYYSASENRYFEWTDAKSDTARQLAEKFIQRFPDVVDAGRGRDWLYAGWLAELLSMLENEAGRLPVVMEDYLEPWGEDQNELPLRSYWTAAGPTLGDRYFPLPPIFDPKEESSC